MVAVSARSPPAQEDSGLSAFPMLRRCISSVAHPPAAIQTCWRHYCRTPSTCRHKSWYDVHMRRLQSHASSPRRHPAHGSQIAVPPCHQTGKVNESMASTPQSNGSQQRSTHNGQTVDSNLLTSLEWRGIGPYRGGRVVAVAGDPSHYHTFYFGSTGGGVWKTSDGGLFWENVSDGYFRRASVGGIAVAPSDPNVIYAGMGEATIRGNVSHGDAVYKSTDPAKT